MAGYGESAVPVVVDVEMLHGNGACLDVTSMCLEVLNTNSNLQAIPGVRKLAVAQSIRESKTQGLACDLLTSLVSDESSLQSIHIDLIGLSEQQVTQQRTLEQPHSTYEKVLAMVVAIFSHSRKIASLPAARRRLLGARMHAINRVDELRELTLACLAESSVILEEDRDRIANDMLDSRYDLLLLPDRFDCDEDILFTVVTDEACPVCLGSESVSVILPCSVPGLPAHSAKHMLCRTCVEMWNAQCVAKDAPATCPLCRSAYDFDQIQEI